MKRVITAILLVTLLSGCESLKLRNLGKSVATTGVVYAIGGAIPATANALTSMAYDEIIPEKEEIKDIQTNQQAAAYLGEQALIYGLIGFIIFLLVTNILVPIVTRQKGYNKAKKKYKGNDV